VLRSRSLWDTALVAQQMHSPTVSCIEHQTAGPDGSRLLVVERTVRRDGDSAEWRLLVAADLQQTEAAVRRFNGVLAASLAGLLVLLCAAAVAQVAVGLAPLRALQRTLAGVREGRSQRLDGQFPAELQPLIDDFNAVLERNAQVVARARTQAGNLAHAIKTPLAAMAQAAATAAARPGRPASSRPWSRNRPPSPAVTSTGIWRARARRRRMACPVRASHWRPCSRVCCA
jgi:signal transduction histidine kinase